MELQRYRLGLYCHMIGIVVLDFFITAARVGLMHIGVFILLLLSGERNFGVRLNKPYTASVPMDIPVFTGEIMHLAAIGLPFWMK